MTQPLNINTNLPMSLQVDKMQQIQQTRPEQLQYQLARRLDRINDQKQTQVASNQEAENNKIGDDDGSNSGQSYSEGRKEGGEEEEASNNCGGRGRYIDIKI
ncbi:MAG: hypothetical protein ACOCZM_01455 [Bacillota bacterium]